MYLSFLCIIKFAAWTGTYFAQDMAHAYCLSRNLNVLDSLKPKKFDPSQTSRLNPNINLIKRKNHHLSTANKQTNTYINIAYAEIFFFRVQVA